MDLTKSNSTFEDLPDPALGVLGLGEKACNPTCIDPIYNSIHDSITWADNLFTMCFGLSTGILAIGTYDRRFQQGEMLWTVQRENELGYTYDVYDMRKCFLIHRNSQFPRKSRRMITIFVCPNRFGGSMFRV